MVTFFCSNRVSGVIACGFAAVVNRITTVFPVSLLHSQPTELVEAYLHAISQLTQSFLHTAMRNEDVSSHHFKNLFHIDGYIQLRCEKF